MTGSRDAFKGSILPGNPTFDELKQARHAGPDALAELLARRVPGQIADIAVGAAATQEEEFIAALLRRRLDPNATGLHGITT